MFQSGLWLVPPLSPVKGSRNERAMGPPILISPIVVKIWIGFWMAVLCTDAFVTETRNASDKKALVAAKCLSFCRSFSIECAEQQTFFPTRRVLKLHNEWLVWIMNDSHGSHVQTVPTQHQGRMAPWVCDEAAEAATVLLPAAEHWHQEKGALFKLCQRQPWANRCSNWFLPAAAENIYGVECKGVAWAKDHNLLHQNHTQINATQHQKFYQNRKNWWLPMI